MPTFLWSLVFLLLLTCGRAGAKAHIHVVLARYDEDVSWIQDYAQRTDVKFIVYNKGEPLTGSVQSSQNVDIIPIRNLGLEAGTYLHHIVHNYDNLAELTVFLQAAEPTHIPPGHLYPGVTFEDYLKKPLYVPTILVTADMKEVSYRKGYHGFGPVEASFNPCPADGLDRWFNFGPFSYWDIVQGRRIKEQSAEFPTLESMWSSLLPRIPYPKHAIAMSHGAQFSVSRQNIVQHPLEFYQRLWDANQKSSESYTAFYLEYMWWYIFFFDTEHQSPCSLDTAALASHPRWDMSHPELPKWVRMQEQAYGMCVHPCPPPLFKVWCGVGMVRYGIGWDMLGRDAKR